MHFELDQNPFLVTTPERPGYALRSTEPSYSPQSSPRRSTRQRHSPYSPITRIFSSLQQAQSSPNDNHPSSPEQSSTTNSPLSRPHTTIKSRLPAAVFPTRTKATITYNELCTVATIYRAINKHAPGTPVMTWFEELVGEGKKRQHHVSLSILTGIGKNSCLKAKQLLQKYELEEAANVVSTPSIDGLDNNADHVPVPNNHDTPSYPTAVATIAFNSNAGVTLSLASAIATVRKGRTGRPKQQNDSLKEIIYTIIKDTSNDGIPNSTHLIRNRLEQDFNIKVSMRTINRTLHDLGCYWGTGTRRHLNHDSKANVKYRHEYLRRRLANLSSRFTRDGQGQEWIPRYPEVFFDESYCHLDHTNPCRWVIPGVPVAQPGHSPLLVIFAAYVVWFDGRRVRSKLVDGSVYIWPSKGQAHTRGPGTGRRAQHDAAMWNEVPDFIREANIVPPDHNDYHGNFTAELFDKMFTGVCKSLQDMGLEKCRIHLDGASYHFHKASSKPAGNRKADLVEWIQREDVKGWLAKDSIKRWLEQKNLDPSPTSTAVVLKDVAKRYADRSKWTIYDIAKKNGNHIIRKTPPYHCELQPIEKIWAVVKNMVAAGSTGRHTALSLKRTLVEHFFNIPEKLFLSVWRKSILIGIEYKKNEPKIDGADGQEQDGGDITDNDNEEEEEEVVVGEAEVVAAAVADDDEEEETPVFDPEVILAGLTEQMWLLSWI